jgi:hypothetical protein
MKNIKKTAIFVAFALLLFGISACDKVVYMQKNAAPAVESTSVGIPDSVYYSNSSQAMYVVELINIDTKKVFTTIIYPNRNLEQLTVPGYLSTGLYNVVITPEGAYSKITTHYAIGGISDSTSKYPATIKNASIQMNNKSSISIALY